MVIDAGLIISTCITIIILSILGTSLLFWFLNGFQKFNALAAVGTGASLGMILIALFIFWLIGQLPVK